MFLCHEFTLTCELDHYLDQDILSHLLLTSSYFCIIHDDSIKLTAI